MLTGTYSEQSLRIMGSSQAWLIKRQRVQAATLRSVMGSECRHVYHHNLNLTATQQGDVKAILDALEAYFKPVRNVIYKRYVFGCCKQEEEESIDNFVTRLREKAATCDYGGLKDEMIRDKIVLGITNEGTRRRLLSEKNLTLLTAIEKCRTAEQTALYMRAMDTASMSPAETVHGVARKPFRHNQRKQSNSPRHVNTAVICIQEAGSIVQHMGKHADSVEPIITLLKCALKAKTDLQRGNCTALKIPKSSCLFTVMMTSV